MSGLKLLADFYAESVDVFTITVGLLVASKFQISDNGRWTIERALVDSQSSSNANIMVTDPELEFQLTISVL